MFCVFSGNGVNGLRRYFNSTPEFNEYTDSQVRTPRQRPTPPDGGDGIPNPTVDMDAIDDGEDDDMGDGSEIVLDHPIFHQAADNNNAALNHIPPPPPLHHPPAGAGAGVLSFGDTAALQSINGSAQATTLPNGITAAGSPHGSLEHAITASPAPTTATPGPAAAPSIAGASIFGNHANATAGPSTASLQRPSPRVDEAEDSDRT